jgi:DNA polymerase-3 subunit gamma/tau
MPTGLLYQLDLASKADYQYRSAKNQRLHIELTLMKMCTSNQIISAPAEGAKKKIELAINSVAATPAVTQPVSSPVSVPVAAAVVVTPQINPAVISEPASKTDCCRNEKTGESCLNSISSFCSILQKINFY